MLSDMYLIRARTAHRVRKDCISRYMIEFGLFGCDRVRLSRFNLNYTHTEIRKLLVIKRNVF